VLQVVRYTTVRPKI